MPRQIFISFFLLFFLSSSLFAWMDEAFIPVQEDRAVSGEKIIANSLGMTFVRIPAGEFYMGSPEEESGRDDDNDEKLHKVKISRAFYIMTTEVTQGQWEAVMGSNPSYFKDCGKDCPVETVSWNDIQEFIRRLNVRDKSLKVRLPSEAEWEYAARAGTKTSFAFDNCLLTSEANYDGRYPLPECPEGIYREKPVKVASFKPNAWGLYDMHGNVREWVQDIYRKDYEKLPELDPIYEGAGDSRVYRGGGWGSLARYCRSAIRSRYRADVSFSIFGVRLAGN